MPLNSAIQDAIRYAFASVGAATEFVTYVESIEVNADKGLEAQPYYSSSALPETIYVDSAQGDDVLGDGSLSNPFASLRNTLPKLGTANEALRVIQLADGHDEVLPTTIATGSNVKVLGARALVDTGPIDTVVAATEAAIVLDLDLPGTYAEDELREMIIFWDTGPAASRHGCVYGNDATADGLTRVRVSQDDVAALRVPLPSNTVSIFERRSTLRLASTVVLTQCPSLTFEEVTFDGNFVMFALATEKITLTRCLSRVQRLQAGKDGTYFLLCSHVANTGSGKGVAWAVNNGGFNVFRGTVFDGDRVLTPGQGFFGVDSNGFLDFRGNNIMVDGDGFQFNGSRVFYAENPRAHDVFSFQGTCSAGLVINGSGKSTGLDYVVPNLLGAVTSDYGIVAELGAWVRYGASTSLVSGLGTNEFSADGGASNATTDGTGRAQTLIESL